MAVIPARAERRLSAPLALIVPALLFGLLVTLQWRTQQERSELTTRYNAPLLDAANSLQNEQNALKAQLADLRNQLDGIQKSGATQSSASRDLQDEIEALRRAAGLTDVTGDGVLVTLDDARGTPASQVSNVEKSIAHNTDITDIINAAWRGGATAVAVNGERVVGATSVYCVGSTIMVNGTLMSPPFSLVVIGPPDRLLGVFDDPNQLRDIKQRRDVYGLGFRVTRASAIRIGAYAGALNVHYGSPAGPQ